MHNRKKTPSPAPTQNQQLQATIESLNNELRVLNKKYINLLQTTDEINKTIASNQIQAGNFVKWLHHFYCSN